MLACRNKRISSLTATLWCSAMCHHLDITLTQVNVRCHCTGLKRPGFIVMTGHSISIQKSWTATEVCVFRDENWLESGVVSYQRRYSRRYNWRQDMDCQEKTVMSFYVATRKSTGIIRDRVVFNSLVYSHFERNPLLGWRRRLIWRRLDR